MRKLVVLLFILITVMGISGVGIWWAIGSVGGEEKTVTFVIPQRRGDFKVATVLKEQGLIKHEWAFGLLWGYWLIIPEGLRKEQIGEVLTKILGWDDGKTEQWNNYYQTTTAEYQEGVYFPDTYLLPKDESGEQIAKRFIARFNEKFAPLSEQFLAKDIRWTTGLKIASLIQREAAGSQDMNLISGIIWNRLENNMKLDIDATLQYIKGKSGGYWWAPISVADKKLQSPFNTYIFRGLPPTPITNPGLAAIEAALNPQETNCLFYLHDRSREIHCSETYEGHMENIKKYLL
ncbi:MAG: Aminodeoxychorismate lyase [Microgenomates group bacterium GW2011_GWA2_44_7]|nr:MAG: Aminodeoxychorismate lyase [Microgenomates group bacterium GW2011_GWA2_44_7]